MHNLIERQLDNERGLEAEEDKKEKQKREEKKRYIGVRTGIGHTVFETHTVDVDSHRFQGISGLSLIRVASGYGYNDWG